MAAGQMFKYLIKLGKEIFGTNNKSKADELLKQGGKKFPKSQITAQTKIKKAPTIPNPRVNGKFTKPRPVDKPKTTAVGAQPKSPSVPSGPKVDKTPANQTKTRAVSTKNNPKTRNTMKDITPPTRAISGSTPKKTPTPVGRPNAKTSAAGAVRLSTTVGSAPEIDTKAPTPPGKKSSRLDKKGETPKKKVKVTPNNKSGESPKKKKPTNTRTTSIRPKLRPTTTPKKTTSPKPKTDPLKNWSEPRRKALKSKKIGQDAGDGMVWIVGKNSNALVRVRPNDPRVAEQKRLQKRL